MSAPPTDLTSLPATELVRLIRSGEVSAVEVTEAALARVDALDGHLHAFCEPTPELARATARGVAEALARGDDVGPLPACRSP